jgi:DNA-binding XRE family transcriptional regulator
MDKCHLIFSLFPSLLKSSLAIRGEKMKTTTGKRKLEGFITPQEHMRLLRKNRPEVYAILKYPNLRTCVSWNNLKRREKLNLSQGDLAKKSGVSNRAVRYLEDITVRFNPTLDLIDKVSKALEVEASDLLKRVDFTKTL